MNAMTMIMWLGVAILLVGLFMLVAGIGQYLWMPIAVILVGVAVAVVGRTRARE
jgi:uncharacterized membrane-anchored protein